MMQYKVRGLAVAALATLATVVGCKTEADDLIMGAKQAEHVSGNTVVPESLAFTAERLATLDVPAGFTITAFATGLGKPRMIAVAGDGTIYVTRQATNDVIALRDDNGDGVAEAPRTVAINLPLVHGIAVRGADVWLASPTQLWRTTQTVGGGLNTPTLISSDLPPAGQHRARTIAIGPDNLLYISAGSTCNACDDPNPENATIMRAQLDGSGRTVYARGLRHTVGFGWHPTTGVLWGMDMQADWRGDNQPPEELNKIVADANYGWPYCYNDKRVDQAYQLDPPGSTKEDFCPTTTAPTLTIQAHNSPLGMTFYTGTQFPTEYRNDAFVALHGSWNRNPPGGYKVVRIHFDNGTPVKVEDFVTGFLGNGGREQFGRPTGIAVAPDGALLFADDNNGVIYRVAFESP